MPLGPQSLRIMRDVGIGVRKVKHQRLHENVLSADKARAIVGY
jgi:hypothetical protein